MKVRPIHRPPRVPAHRMPHCRWKVFIDDQGGEYAQHANLAINSRSKVASVDSPRAASDAEPGGWPDYSGAFDPGFQLEDLSHGALVTVLQEIGVQIHLLARAFHMSVSQRFGADAAAEIAAQQWAGIAALTAERLRTTLAIEGDGIDAVAKVFQMHASFQPRSYVDLRIDLTGERSARLTIGDSPAFEEEDPYTWFSGLRAAPHPALDAIAAAVNPHARCRPVPARAGSHLAWDVVIDPATDPLEPPQALAFARGSQGSSFHFERRRRPRG